MTRKIKDEDLGQVAGAGRTHNLTKADDGTDAVEKRRRREPESPGGPGTEVEAEGTPDGGTHDLMG